MINLRRITDIGELMRWRAEVIENVFGEKPCEALLSKNKEYYRQHIADRSHIALVASFDGEDAGSGSICLTDELPSPDNPSGHCAYLMNIYVRDKFREHGIGHAIVKKLVEIAKSFDCEKIYLETTEAGRSLYAGLGFKDYPDMMKLQEYEHV